MKETSRELLENEINSQILRIHGMGCGSEERKEAIITLKQMYEIAINESKVQSELEMKQEQSKAELELKEQELKEQRIDRWFRLGTTIGVLIIELSFYAAFSYVGFKFEEKGTLTSGIFKGLINRFKFTK